jgi:outer membrane receptor protein involved in Fe transport
MTISFTVAGVAKSQPAPAPAAGAAGNEVVVTGSRIVRRDFSAQSPIVTVTQENLQTTATVGIEQALAKLPQFSPGANQFTGAFNVQSTATSTPGASTLNLRALGTNRNLVLVDGRRYQPIDAALDIDINTIPDSAIESIESITGGAAATYGSDAISGVVNFKLRKNFQGLEIDGQFGQTFQGDDQEFKVSALVGGNFADNKGNAMVGMSYASRTAVLQRDRKFWSRAYTDPTTGGDFFADIETLSGVSSATGIPPLGFAPTPYSQAALDAVFGPGVVTGFNSFFTSVSSGFGGTIGINQAPNPANSTLFFVGEGNNGVTAPGFINPGTTVDGHPFYKTFTTSLGFTAVTTNPLFTMLSLPLKRYSMFANAHYEVTDHITAYLQGEFVENETSTILGSNPAVNQWGVFIPYDAATNGAGATIQTTNPITGITTTVLSPHPVPTQLATLLNSRASPNASWELGRGLDAILGERAQDQTFNTYQILGGIKGDLPFMDWTYDIYGSHGNTAIQARYKGFADLAQYQRLIEQPNYGAGADFFIGNRGTIAHCTSGLNPFTNAPVTDDCLAIIDAPITTTTDVTQDVVEADFQGHAFDLPGGDVRIAFGADYRRNGYVFRPDPLMSQTNILGSTVGIFGANPSSGASTVFEGYGEAFIPIVKDMPFAKLITINPGYRFSSYNQASVGGVSTWKVTADWTVVDWLKFRGGYQVANRAPNTAELFQGGNTQVILWPDGDPCATGPSAAPYGNSAANPNRAQVQALCTTLSGGFPIGNAYGNAGFALSLDDQQGNPNLTSESAKTWTVGAVLSSPWHSPAVDHLTASIDYYDIRIDHAIGVLTSQTIYRECFNATGDNPTYSATNFFCQLIRRSPFDGSPQTVTAVYQNFGGIRTAGLDVQLNWFSDIKDLGLGVPGQLSLNSYFNWLNYYETQVNSKSPFVDFSGSGGDGTFTGGIATPLFRYKITTTLGYSYGPGSLNLRWEHLPSVKSASAVTNPANPNNPFPTGAYDLFDLFGTWRITSAYIFRAGIENLFDKQPEATGRTPGIPGPPLVGVPPTSGLGGLGPTYIGVYDILGRRFYIGLKARF